MERITSSHNPLVQHMRKLQTSRAYRESCGEFVADGWKLLEEALKWYPEVTAVLTSEPERCPALPSSARLVEVPASLMQSVSSMRTPQCVLFSLRLPQEGALRVQPGMLLLDRVEREDDVAHGFFRIPEDAWFLKGHFPGNPIVPGVMLCEILAQSVCVLLQSEMTDDLQPLYTGLNNVRFRAPVRPGDLFETRCRITKARRPFFFAEGSGFVGDKLAVKAEFSFALMEKSNVF